jgi:hypothetical protein
MRSGLVYLFRVGLLLVLSSQAVLAHGPLAERLREHFADARKLDGQLAAIDIVTADDCDELLRAHRSALLLIASLDATSAALSGPISLDHNSLQALADLSRMVSSMAGRNLGLSQSLGLLDSSTDRFFLRSGMTAMLRLSDDIGVMADRILEMADKILVMSDNIGVMADRIVETQLIQNTNIAATQSAMLTTQQNILTMINPTSSSTYSVEMDAQALVGNLLARDFAGVILSPFNMSRRLAEFAGDVGDLRVRVDALYRLIGQAASANSFVVDADSYAALADLSIMTSSLAIVLQGRAIVVEAQQSQVNAGTLDLSTQSILAMSADIGIMADRILEMADLILAMADNIGLSADQIMATQQLQSSNYATTLTAIEATQVLAIAIIAGNEP